MIKINKKKSNQDLNFSFHHDLCPIVKLNNVAIPVRDETKYFSIIIGKRSTRSPHLRNKIKTANTRLDFFRLILKSKLNLNSKILLYIRPSSDSSNPMPFKFGVRQIHPTYVLFNRSKIKINLSFLVPPDV